MADCAWPSNIRTKFAAAHARQIVSIGSGQGSLLRMALPGMWNSRGSSLCRKPFSVLCFWLAILVSLLPFSFLAIMPPQRERHLHPGNPGRAVETECAAMKDDCRRSGTYRKEEERGAVRELATQKVRYSAGIPRMGFSEPASDKTESTTPVA